MRNLYEKLILTILLSIAIFNLTTNAQKAELVVQTGHTYSSVNGTPTNFVQRVSFGHNDKILITTDFLGSRLWSVESGKELRTLQAEKPYESPLSLWKNACSCSNNA